MAGTLGKIWRQGALRRGCGLILVTVGMHTQPFDRLVIAADQMATQIEEPVVIQCGVSRYVPTHCTYFDFVDASKMQEWLDQARVVVSQSGAGSILTTLQARVPLVLAPRLKRYSEVFDDHQLELAEALERQGRAVIVTDLSSDTLQMAVERAIQLNASDGVNLNLQHALRAWLDERAAALTSAGRNRRGQKR